MSGNYFRKIPTTAVPINIPDILRSLTVSSEKTSIVKFEKALSEWLSVEDSILVNKGTAACYLILKALRERHPDRDEVIYPAYTVPTLKLAFDKLSLKTRVCDVSRETFNMDAGSLAEQVTDKTLAVFPVHMFGFPMNVDEVIKIVGKDIFVIEDACQAPGARIDNKLVGSFADYSFFSFCKGKNISTFTGGFAALKDAEIAKRVREFRDELPAPSGGLKLTALLIAFALAMRPGVYGPLFPLIKRFKSEDVHQHFDSLKYTAVQAELGNILLEKLEVFNAQRRTNGMFLYEAFKNQTHILIPKIIEGAEPVFNHMPVVFLNEKDRIRAQKLLWEKGIDSARMYLHPNHHIYDLGYPKEAFPNSIEIADGLVTLPAHAFMTKRDLELIVKIVSGK